MLDTRTAVIGSDNSRRSKPLLIIVIIAIMVIMVEANLIMVITRGNLLVFVSLVEHPPFRSLIFYSDSERLC
jgi:hypothetical protein